MKKIVHFRMPIIYGILILLVLVYTLITCKSTETAVAERRPSDALLREFEQSPPVIDSIYLEKLEKEDKTGNTIILVAKVSPENHRIDSINSLPITIGENESVILNDRGVDGDAKANDRLFSIAMTATDQDLQTLINRSNEALNKQNNTITEFAGRVPIRKELKQINLEALLNRRKLEFQLNFISMVTSATLPDIRDKSLMVRDISVVEDPDRTFDPCRNPKGNPDGAWSFKTLVKNMANEAVTGVSVDQFLIDWVDNFLFSLHSLPSTDATTERLASKERLIKAWMFNSGAAVPAGPGIPANWQTSGLRAEAFPVRLLAIVNRLDLRGNPGYGGFNNAGEGRFVFCFVDSRANCSNGNNGPGTMTFILEYGIPIKGCQALVDYAKKWWDLQSVVFGAAFNTELESITNVFTKAGAASSRPNQSALNHFRTNDFLRPTVVIAQDPWDIRDFEIDAASHKLKIIHPNREPMESSNGFGTVPVNATKLVSMVTFANSVPFTAANPNPVYFIPDDIKGIHGPMRVNPNINYHFTGDATNVINPLKRREFSFNACSGCHKGETKNAFTHIRPRNINTAAVLSGFMTGLGPDDNPDPDVDPMGSFFVNDPGPAPKEPQRPFNEALFRASKLEELVFNTPCLRVKNNIDRLIAVHRVLKFRPLNMEH